MWRSVAVVSALLAVLAAAGLACGGGGGARPRHELRAVDVAGARDVATAVDVPTGGPRDVSPDHAAPAWWLHIDGPDAAETCAAVVLSARVDDPAFAAETFAWQVTPPDPAEARYVAIPEGPALTFAAATPGRFRVELVACDAAGACGGAEAAVIVSLSSAAGPWGVDERCGAAPEGVAFLHVAPDTAAPVATCEVHRFAPGGIFAPGADLTFAWEVALAPPEAEYTTAPEGAGLVFRAATPGRYELAVSACRAGRPGPCPRAARALEVRPGPGAGGALDERCVLRLAMRPAEAVPCQTVRCEVTAGPERPPYEWRVVAAPDEALVWLRDRDEQLLLLPATPGDYVVEARHVPPGAPELPVVGRASLRVRDPGDGVAEACAELVVAGPEEVRSCEHAAFSAHVAAEAVAVTAYEWSVAETPPAAVYAVHPDGARLAFVAATAGRYTFGVRGCAVDPDVCWYATAPLTVTLVQDGDGDRTDESCEDTVEDALQSLFVLPYLGAEETQRLVVATTVERGDVLIDLDLTGSMGEAIVAVRDSLQSVVIPELASRIASVGVGVSGFRDFPCWDHGDPGDRPFALVHRITTRAGDVRARVGELQASGGGDGAESGFEALYQIATGAGRTWDCPPGGGAVPPFAPDVDRLAGVADGERGGAGFRDGSAAIVVHITDAPSHAAGQGSYTLGATREEAYAALEALRARIVAVVVGGDPDALADAQELTARTGARVPPCAWGGERERPRGCLPDACCTGTDGAGVHPTGGDCPLVFRVEGGGAVDSSLVAGIQALLSAQVHDVGVRPRRDEQAFEESGVDTTCFVERLEPAAATAAGCGASPTLADFDGDGQLDGVRGVAPGATVTVDVFVRNDCVEHAVLPQTFLVYLDLLDGATRLGTRVLTIVVPGEDPKLPGEWEE